MLVVEDMTCRRGEVTQIYRQHIDRFPKSFPPLLHEYTAIAKAIARRPFVLDRTPFNTFRNFCGRGGALRRSNDLQRAQRPVLCGVLDLAMLTGDRKSVV